MSPERVLVLACGALAAELLDVVNRNRLDHVTVEFVPSRLHNTPALIPGAVSRRLARGGYDRAIIGYGDCGTAGALDAVLENFDAERLPGAHCYEFFSTGSLFASFQDDTPGTFYLTDFLVRHFHRLVWESLGLDRHPELLATYFGSYQRVLYVSQFEDSGLMLEAQRCAERLGLNFEHHHVGLGNLEASLSCLSSTARAESGT